MNNSTIFNYWGYVAGLQREAFRKYQLVPLSIIIVIGFTCNLLVIFSATRKSIWKKYAINPFILNLAVADLGVILYFIPIHFVEYTVGLNIADWTCKYIIPIRETFVSVSLFTVANLSMVRFWKTRTTTMFSKRFIYTTIIVTWLLAYLVISMPIAFVIRHTAGMTCDHVWEKNVYRIAHITVINIFQLLPLLVTTICYSSIITKLRKTKEWCPDTLAGRSPQYGNVLGILMLIIVAWWSFAPFLVFSFLVIIEVELSAPLIAWSAVTVFLTSSSAINPILVLIMYKSYREEIMKLFCKGNTCTAPAQAESNSTKMTSARPLSSIQTQLGEATL